MSIKVRYFASLKEWVGRSEDTLEMTPGLSVRATWELLNPNKAMPDATLAAINMQYVDLDTDMGDGDELAFFPPVTGG